MSQAGPIDIIGSNPEIPTEFIADTGNAIPIANQLELLGDTVAAGTNPVYTSASGNTVTTNVQISQAIASTNANNVGLAAFDSADFTVDANGFVSAIDSSGVITTTYNLADTGSTWTKDSRTKTMELYIWGGGGGGGSGRKGTTGAAGGGGGGGGAQAAYFNGPSSKFPNTALITIGAGGTGGASQTTDATNGNPGLAGGVSSFGSLSGVASSPGAGGTTNTATPGQSLGIKTISGVVATINVEGQAGTGSNTTSLNIGRDVTGLSPSGGGGGGGADTTTERSGNRGGNFISGVTTLLAGGLAGLESTGINGGNGNSPTGLFPTGSATGLIAAGTGGGGGGGYSVGAGGATAGGNGGGGAVPGGGGGGGGGGLTGVANSGAGGAGGDGRITVVEYF